jgi:hypothetical protein
MVYGYLAMVSVLVKGISATRAKSLIFIVYATAHARGVERRLALNALSANGPGHIRFPCQGIPEPGGENQMRRK